MLLLVVRIVAINLTSGEIIRVPFTLGKIMMFVVVNCRIGCIASLGLRGLRSRERWIRCVKRVTKDKKPWYPCSSDRVCSEHFVDGIPTEENPDPSLKMGYELPEQPTSRRSLVKQPLAKKPKVAASSSICNEGQELETASDSSSLIIHECGNNLLMKVHDTKCDSCEVKASTILTLSKEIEALR